MTKVRVTRRHEEEVEVPFSIGQKVIYQPWSGEATMAVITGFGEKDGQVVVDVRHANGKNWGYLDQIHRAVRAKRGLYDPLDTHHSR